jgi:hypothetical protein
MSFLGSKQLTPRPSLRVYSTARQIARFSQKTIRFSLVTFLHLTLKASLALKNKEGFGENVVRKILCEKLCLFCALCSYYREVICERSESFSENPHNHTHVLHVLVGPYDLFDFRNLNGQAARRGRDLHFSRYRLERQEECAQFVGALQYLLSHVPLDCDVSHLVKQWRWFAEWSVGCVGILRDWLVETVAALLAEGSTTFTLEALQAYALSPGQRLRLEMETRSGEHKVESGNESSHQQLQQLLALPTPVGEKRSTSSRVGERAPSRDPVGEEERQEHALKCPGSTENDPQKDPSDLPHSRQTPH